MKYDNRGYPTMNAKGITRITRLGGLALASLLLGACASGPKSFAIRGDGDQVLNRDVRGKSLSVVVRLYQLKDSAEFSKLTFDTVAEGRPDADLLGPSLLAKTDTIVVPGGTYTSTETIQEGARYIGLIALFRQPDAQYWRFLVDADDVRSNGLKFKVQDCYITLNGTKPVPIPGQPANYKPNCQAYGPALAPIVSTTSSKAGQAGKTQAQPQRRATTSRSALPDVTVNTPGTATTASGTDNTINIGINPGTSR